MSKKLAVLFIILAVIPRIASFNGFIQYDARDEFVRQMALIPSEELNFLKIRGWKFELTDTDLADKYGYEGKISGVTDYENKTIYIMNTEYSVRRALLHEAGHALASELRYPDYSEEFYELYQLEKDNFTDCTSAGDGHEISNPIAYYASVYQNMILDYDETFNEVPNTVRYIERTLYYARHYTEIIDNLSSRLSHMIILKN